MRSGERTTEHLSLSPKRLLERAIDPIMTTILIPVCPCPPSVRDDRPSGPLRGLRPTRSKADSTLLGRHSAGTRRKDRHDTTASIAGRTRHGPARTRSGCRLPVQPAGLAPPARRDRLHARRNGVRVAPHGAGRRPDGDPRGHQHLRAAPRGSRVRTDRADRAGSSRSSRSSAGPA